MKKILMILAFISIPAIAVDIDTLNKVRACIDAVESEEEDKSLREILTDYGWREKTIDEKLTISENLMEFGWIELTHTELILAKLRTCIETIESGLVAQMPSQNTNPKTGERP